ncbi:MAG: dephospho-CoA kinase [Rhodobacter sp.]|nr:dephospho-CoA kinase [Rhodobacter sp.]
MQNRPFRIGLTGSIGMGKTTTAQMFSELGIPVWNADDVVHRLYAKNGAGVEKVAAVCPEAIEDGAVNRRTLRQMIAKNPDALKVLEQAVHPLVAADRLAFLRDTESEIVVLDIPLLFETGAEASVDVVVVVSAPAALQRQRVLERGDMTEAEFETILAKQIPDVEKRQRADYVIETVTLEAARVQVHACLHDIEQRLAHA